MPTLSPKSVQDTLPPMSPSVKSIAAQSDGGDSDRGSEKEKDKDKLSSKLKGIFKKSGKSEAASSTSNESSPVSEQRSLPSPPSINNTPLKTIPMFAHSPSHLPLALPMEDKSEQNPFQADMLRAQAAVQKLQTTQAIFKGTAAVLELGAGWLPGVGKGLDLIVQMLSQAEQISVGKVSALRLVERSASVLTAVEQSVIDNHGHFSPVMQKNIDALLSNLHDSAYLLTKLSQRPFLKLYLHADDAKGKIDKATQDLTDLIFIFQVQSQISSAAWQEESRKDHEKDIQLLLQKQEEARKDDQSLLLLLEVKAEQQQEAIKTLQRTLDAILSHQFVDAIADANAEGRSESPDQLESPGLQLATQTFQTSSTGEGVPVPSPKEARPRERYDTFTSVADANDHREFCQRALDVLRRHSSNSEIGVPDWTITDLEVTHGERISSGFFSVVYKGRWQNQDVAIKELNSTADRNLFIHEVEVWRQLRSPFILPFFGASSTTGPPPWILVSPYMMNKDVLSYVKQAGSSANKLALVHQIAQGMEYLHKREIVHSDLKAANVLVTDSGSAVLCDFGLSQLKLHILTKSQNDPALHHALGGTMRWQSPERLAGARPTYACDIYAFAMTVYEIFTGEVPFGYVDDYVLREAIIKGERPVRPKGKYMPDELWKLIDECWTQEPDKRPWFEEISDRLSSMYVAPPTGHGKQPSLLTISSAVTSTNSSLYTTAEEGYTPEEQRAISPQSNTRPLPDLDEESSSSGSIASIPPHLEKELSFESDRVERHYRHYLQHEFDDRLTVPLWFPSVIPLGSVGYIRHGQFIKLLDAKRPPMDLGELPPVPYLDEFSSLQTQKTPVHARTTAEKGLDFMTTLKTNFVKSSGEQVKQSVSRRIAFPLKPGNKSAILLLEDGEFEVYKSLSEARLYLTANLEWVLKHYGDSHHISKEDLIIVVGVLRAHNYTMLVSNFAPRTTLTFNVHANPEKGKAWGTWTVTNQQLNASKAFKGNTSASSTAAAPSPAQETHHVNNEHKYIAKVSDVPVQPSPMDVVMLAKLKYAAGGLEPALYP